MLVRWSVLLLFVLLLTGAASVVTPQSDLWGRWQAHDPTSVAQIDHTPWEDFLMRYLRIGADGVHRVAYGNVDDTDRAALDRYLGYMAAIPIEKYNRDEQLAYWINLYNALLVRLVLDNYPVRSVQDIGDGGPWDEKLIEVADVPLSLDDIQHRILRSIWRDPRIHYALSCAAVGCPNLQPEAYRGPEVQDQLTAAAMAYINDPRCIRTEGSRLFVSSIFRWYKEDFGGTDRAIINHLMAYAEPMLAMKLQKFGRITGDMFDWRLNDATVG